MHLARIAELLEPYLGSANVRSELAPSGAKGLTVNDLEHISIYIDLLLRWNARINLTAIRDPEEIVTRHFGESLFAAHLLFPAAERQQNAAHGASRGSAVPDGPAPEGRKKMLLVRSDQPLHEEVSDAQCPTPDARPSIADLGSGAGFPGLPIKLWAPEISLTLIESNHKKSTFLREVTRALTLTNVNIQTTRAEALSGTTFDVVTLRAVEHFDSILLTAASLVAPQGRLALLIGSAQTSQARALLPHLTWSDTIPVPRSQSRVVVIASRPKINERTQLINSGTKMDIIGQ